MPSKAVDKLRPTELDVTAELSAVHADLEDFILGGKGFGKQLKELDVDIRDAVLDAIITISIEGASVVEITLIDDDRVLLRSGIFDFGVILKIRGKEFKLVKVNKTGNQLKLTFEDYIVALLRGPNSFRKMSRGKVTRAEFILLLIREIKKRKIKTFIPELHKEIAIKKERDRVTESERKKRRAPGLTNSGLTMKDVDATATQVKNAERVLDVGFTMNVPRVVLIAAIETIIVESTGYNLAGGDADSRGLFQQQKYIGGQRTSWPASRDIEQDSAGFYKVALQIHRASPGLPAGEIAWRVQQPREDLRGLYHQRRIEATEFVNNYTGSNEGVGSGDSRVIKKKYEFSRGIPDATKPGGHQKENSWKAIQRLVGEVQWRAFVLGNDTIAVVSEEYLFKSAPWIQFSEDDPEVYFIDFDWDTGKREGECVVIADARRWFISPGATVAIKRGYGPATGKWLVSSVTRSYFKPSTEVILRKPMKALKEPANETRVVATEAGDPRLSGTQIRGGDVLDRVVKAAQKALANKNKYDYSQDFARPMKSLFTTTDTKIFIDCSTFVTLCYKAARAEDPNGLNYNGFGFTGTLWTHGRPTNNPVPGDLAFWGTPSLAGSAAHVAVYIGNNQVIGTSGNNLGQYAVNYKPLAGFRTYGEHVLDTLPKIRDNAPELFNE